MTAAFLRALPVRRAAGRAPACCLTTLRDSAWRRRISRAVPAFTGQQEGLLRLFGEVAVAIRLTRQPGTDHQPGLFQQPGDTVRLPPVKVQRDRVTECLCQVPKLVACLERQLHQTRPEPAPGRTQRRSPAAALAGYG